MIYFNQIYHVIMKILLQHLVHYQNQLNVIYHHHINKGQNQPILTDLPRNHFPTLQTVLNQSSKDSQTKFPQPPPLLNGILLLDQMLTNSTGSNDERTQTLSSSTTSNSGWYNVTSNYQTRASIV